MLGRKDRNWVIKVREGRDTDDPLCYLVEGEVEEGDIT